MTCTETHGKIFHIPLCLLYTTWAMEYTVTVNSEIFANSIKTNLRRLKFVTKA